MKMTRLSLLMAGFVASVAVGTWSPRASLPTARAGHTATLLNSTGNVLVTSYGTATVYNPYDDVWRPTPWMVVDRSNATATWIQDTSQVLVAGGRGWQDVPFSSAELYDSVANTWRATGSMSTARYRHTATMLDSGQVLVTGGDYSLRGQRRSAELYEPATGTWSSVQPLPEALSGHAATLLYSGKVLVTGGYNLDSWYHNADPARTAAYLFDPATRAWSPAGHMSRVRRNHVSIRLYSGSVLVAGHARDNSDTSSDVYDPYNDQWLPGPSLPIPGPYVSATMLYSGEVLVLNTSGQGALYDPSANAWRLTASTQVQGYSLAMLLHTGQVLAIGEGAMERFSR